MKKWEKLLDEWHYGPMLIEKRGEAFLVFESYTSPSRALLYSNVHSLFHAQKLAENWLASAQGR